MEATNAEWRATGGYMARHLAGVWTTAPYLHNGSVPTLFDLLSPPDQRPKTFPLGHREFDPKKVGYVTDVPKPLWVFKTREAGNSNVGHPFGTDLSEADKWALIEYLKTKD